MHSTSLHLSILHFFSFKLYPTTLRYYLIWLNPIQISYRSISPHITTFHLTSLHCTFRRFSPHFYSFHITPFIITLLNFCLKIEVYKGKYLTLLQQDGSSFSRSTILLCLIRQSAVTHFKKFVGIFL